MNLGFRRMREEDLLLVHEWLQRPHVVRWWRERAAYGERSASAAAASRSDDRASISSRMGRALLGAVLPILLLVIWEIASQERLISPLFLPAPSMMSLNVEPGGRITLSSGRFVAGSIVR